MKRTKDTRFRYCPYCHRPPKVAYGITGGFAYCNGGLLFNKQHETISAESHGYAGMDIETCLIENWNQTVVKVVLDKKKEVR